MIETSSLPAPSRRTRPVRVLPGEVLFDRREDGTVYVKSLQELGPYPQKLTDRLEHWARESPHRIFLAQRSSPSSWRRLTYGQTLPQVRSIAEGLLQRGLHAQTRVMILAGNGIEHALLALGCMYAGVPYAPIPPSYARASCEITSLRDSWQKVEPALAFTDEKLGGEKPALEALLSDLLNDGTELVTVHPPQVLRATTFDELLHLRPDRVDEAHARVTADSVAKLLFTSGSTGVPKGVITTQRMLCSNQEMLRTVLSFLADEPPVLCDWLPWNHVFGGSHNFGIALYNGGTLYVDEGKPTSTGFATTLKNLREVATTAYFNVPKGYEMLVPILRAEPEFRRHFFSRVQILFYAAAGMNQRVCDELRELAIDACGEEILIIAGLGATETAPFALSTGRVGASAGYVGLPVPGVELKLVPAVRQFEVRLRGPNITPGFWREPELTAAAFDEEGFYKLGDALSFADAANPERGFNFAGRLNEDFKLATGTWVLAGLLRDQFLHYFVSVAEDVIITAPDRDYVGALVFPKPGVSADRIQELLSSFAQQNTGLSTCVRRALLLDEPPSLEAGELTGKGTANQNTVPETRAALVEELYAGSPRVIRISSRTERLGGGS